MGLTEENANEEKVEVHPEEDLKVTTEEEAPATDENAKTNDETVSE